MPHRNEQNRKMVTRPTVNKAQWDGPRALAAATILRAIKDYTGRPEPSYSDTERRNGKPTAAAFLQGPMEPWAELLEFDPETDLEYRQWCRSVGLVAGKYCNEEIK